MFTVDDGWGWIFTAVEHWNAEIVSATAWLQARRPLRRPAADLHGACRAVWLDRGRRGSGAGLADGSRLPVSVETHDHQPDQVLGHPWPSYAFVAEPQIQQAFAERFNRTLKEQIIHGRIYRNIAELRDAVRDFVELYNAQWIVEKNGYLSPASSSSGVARRDLNQARRSCIDNLCTKEPGALQPDQHVVGEGLGAHGDAEQRAEGGVACPAPVEAEHELVEIALQVLGAQPVIDAARPALEIGEHLMDPGQHEVGGHGTDDVGIVGLDGGRGVAGPAVGLGGAGGGDVVADEAVEAFGAVGD